MRPKHRKRSYWKNFEERVMQQLDPIVTQNGYVLDEDTSGIDEDDGIVFFYVFGNQDRRKVICFHASLFLLFYPEEVYWFTVRVGVWPIETLVSGIPLHGLREAGSGWLYRDNAELDDRIEQVRLLLQSYFAQDASSVD